MGMGVRQHDQKTPGEEGLQMPGSGGKPAVGSFFPSPSFPGDTSSGQCDPGDEERTGQPHPAILGFCQGIYLP